MKTIKNKKTIGIIAVVVIILLAIFAVLNAKRKEAALPIAKEYGIVVSTIKPELKEVALTLPYLAQTENDKDVNLSSKVTARVNFIQPSGTKVKKGAIIARLDNTSIQTNSASLKSQIKATQTSLKNLEETHQRTKELLAIKGASIEQYQKEESSIETLKAKLNALQQNQINVANTLTYSTILSPVDGIISKTLVNKGDMCLPGHPVATIRATNGFYLLLRVPTNLTIYGVNFKNENYSAIALNSTFNSLAEYKVYVNSKGFTTGDRIEVNVIVFKGEAIKLPFDAILNRDGESFVLAKENDKAKAIPVTIIQSGEEGVVISNPAIVGKEIIVAKQDILLRLLGGTNITTQKN
ncbi:RND transporter [Lutibacter profundi]|uniref:RND transporter n=1 Tax=Lutibacter profundi TaxID=1622118 RepID=A0A120IEB1_9FLAO|nr:efflux RND transporter periplasmic adaptor subunit [Lutibacter profundi]AMC11097.1 RND transporter [Lutibacter profundi]